MIDFAHFGSSLSLRSRGRFGGAASVLEEVHVGSSLSFRSIARFGSSVSVFGIGRFGSRKISSRIVLSIMPRVYAIFNEN